jgi:hypothetical protein
MVSHPIDGIHALNAGESPHGFPERISPSAGMDTHETKVCEHILPRFGSSDQSVASGNRRRLLDAQRFYLREARKGDEMLVRVVDGTGGMYKVFPGILRFEGERWKRGA